MNFFTLPRNVPLLFSPSFKDNDDQLVVPDATLEDSLPPLAFSEREKIFLKALERDPYAGCFGSMPQNLMLPYYVLKNVLKDKDEKFTLKSAKHLRLLSVAFHYFDTHKDLKELTENEREICLRLHEKHRQMELQYKLPPPSESVDSRIISGLKFSRTLLNIANKLIAFEAIGQIIGIVANDYTLNEDDFERLYPNDSFDVKAIPAFLNSGIKISLGLQQKLTNRRLDPLEQQFSKMTEITPNSTLFPERAFEEACDLIEHLNNSKIPLSSEQTQILEKFVEQAEMALPSEEAIVVELRKAEFAKDEFAIPANNAKKLKDAVKISKEVGRAIHTWSQHSHKEDRHSKNTSIAYQEYSACLNALNLEDHIEEFPHQSRPNIQKLIARKLIENHENALEQRIAITKEYGEEIATTKKALEDCRKNFCQLGLQGNSLQDLGNILHKYQKKVDHYHKKRSRLFKIGNAICDGIAIAGQIATAFAAPVLGPASGVGAFVKSSKGEKFLSSVGIFKQGINLLSNHNDSQWAKSQNWYKQRLNEATESSKALHETRDAVQGHYASLKHHREQQRDYLIMHPEQFLSISYRSYLLEELASEKEGLREIQKRQEDYKVAIAQNNTDLGQLTTRESKLNKKMKGLSSTGCPQKYKSTLTRLTDVRNEMAQRSSENSLLQIELDRLQDSTKNSLCGSIETRLQHIKHENSLPEHHRSDGDRLPLDVRVSKSDVHLRELQNKLSVALELPPEEYNALKEKQTHELLFNHHLKQEQIYHSLKRKIRQQLTKISLQTYWSQ